MLLAATEPFMGDYNSHLALLSTFSFTYIVQSHFYSDKIAHNFQINECRQKSIKSGITSSKTLPHIKVELES